MTYTSTVVATGAFTIVCAGGCYSVAIVIVFIVAGGGGSSVVGSSSVASVTHVGRTISLDMAHYNNVDLLV